MQMNTQGTGALTWPSASSAYSPKVATTGTGTAAETTPVVNGARAAGYADSVNTGTQNPLETDSADGTEDRFLKLLVAQMRNQDPLNPLDNAQVTSQLAQISTVRGIEGLNKTMSDFVASGAQNSAIGAVGLLGKQVLVPGDGFVHQPGTSAAATTRIGFDLAAPATAARIDVVDASGKVVFSETMRNLEAGMQTLDWDGRDGNGAAVSAGPLSVQVLAVDGTVAVDAQALVPGRVTGISQGADGTRLELDGTAPVSPSDVRVIL